MDVKGNVLISHEQLLASAAVAREWAAKQLRGGGWAPFGKKTPAQQAADYARKEEKQRKKAQEMQEKQAKAQEKARSSGSRHRIRTFCL